MERFMERDIAKDNENTDRFMIYCCQTMTVPWYTDVTLWQFHALLVSHSEHSMIYCYRTNSDLSLIYCCQTLQSLKYKYWNTSTFQECLILSHDTRQIRHRKIKREGLHYRSLPAILTVWSSIISCYGNFGIWFSTFAVRL